MSLPAGAQDPSLIYKLMHNRLVNAVGAALPLGGLMTAAACSNDAPKGAEIDWVVEADCPEPQAELRVEHIKAPRKLGTATLELLCVGGGEASIPTNLRISQKTQDRPNAPQRSTIIVTTWYQPLRENVSSRDSNLSKGRILEEEELYTIDQGYVSPGVGEGVESHEQYHGAQVSFDHTVVTKYQVGSQAPTQVHSVPKN